jgi:hypothetical protein
MENEILVPSEPQESPQETDSTDYKKLSDALRGDMRDACRWLLVIRKMSNREANNDGGMSKQSFADLNVELLDNALAALDCYEAFDNGESS